MYSIFPVIISNQCTLMLTQFVKQYILSIYVIHLIITSKPVDLFCDTWYDGMHVNGILIPVFKSLQPALLA